VTWRTTGPSWRPPTGPTPRRTGGSAGRPRHRRRARGPRRPTRGGRDTLRWDRHHAGGRLAGPDRPRAGGSPSPLAREGGRVVDGSSGMGTLGGGNSGGSPPCRISERAQHARDAPPRRARRSGVARGRGASGAGPDGPRVAGGAKGSGRPSSRRRHRRVRTGGHAGPDRRFPLGGGVGAVLTRSEADRLVGERPVPTRSVADRPRPRSRPTRPGGLVRLRRRVRSRQMEATRVDMGPCSTTAVPSGRERGGVEDDGPEPPWGAIRRPRRSPRRTGRATERTAP
jgi:hypothetical protein